MSKISDMGQTVEPMNKELEMIERDKLTIAEQNKDKENKAENKKALKVFIPIIIGAGLVGGVLGFLVVFIGKEGFTFDVESFCRDIIIRISPWGVILCGIAGNILTAVFYKKSVKHYKSALNNAEEGERDEREMQIIDANISNGMMTQSVSMIIQFMFFGLVVVNLDLYVELVEAWIMVVIVLFMVFCFMEIKYQQKMVDMEKILNPSKVGSVYDTKFVKKWEDSCDEMEKILIYKSAYKAYRACNIACIILWAVFAILGMAFNVGFLPIIAVSAIWLTATMTYMLEARKLETNKLN